MNPCYPWFAPFGQTFTKVQCKMGQCSIGNDLRSSFIISHSSLILPAAARESIENPTNLRRRAVHIVVDDAMLVLSGLLHFVESDFQSPRDGLGGFGATPAQPPL